MQGVSTRGKYIQAKWVYNEHQKISIYPLTMGRMKTEFQYLKLTF